MDEMYGKYYEYKNKYEDQLEESKRWHSLVESQQQVIEQYQKYFADRKHLSTLQEVHQRS